MLIDATKFDASNGLKRCLYIYANIVSLFYEKYWIHAIHYEIKMKNLKTNDIQLV